MNTCSVAADVLRSGRGENVAKSSPTNKAGQMLLGEGPPLWAAKDVALAVGNNLPIDGAVAAIVTAAVTLRLMLLLF